MARDTIIAERPVPPKGRLSFPMLILCMIANPVASWGEDFYEEPAVLYRWLGLQTLYVMDPVLIQRILLDDAENYSKQPLNDDMFGEAIGGGQLNAERDVVTFLMAGHETTSQALTWTLYLLALFPEWQERLREEVRRVNPNGDIGGDDIGKLQLLDAVFQEAIRLYSPAPVLMRRTVAPVRLDGITLGKGATIIIPIYVVHRQKRLWEDPLKFDPSRFTPQVRAGCHRCAYMPFGAGPRTCVGAAFAMLEGKTILATLLSHARFDLPDGEAPIPFARITLRPKNGLTLKVTLL